MAKVKNWRLALVVILAAFLFGTLAVTFINFPLGRAGAEDIGVLPGNTAEYTIVNDGAHPWIYERATNTWYNNADKSSGLIKTLTVKVTSPGDIVFKYKTNLYTSNKQGGTQYAFNNNDFYLELTKGGITNTIVTKHGEKMADFEQLTIKDMAIDDTLVFKHCLAGLSTSDDDRVYVQGLAMPSATNVTITAKADGSGKISCEEDENTLVEKSVVAGLPVKLTAKADEGNTFAYWTDKNDTIISYDDTLSLTPLETTSYTAHFVKSDIAQFSTVGWETTDNGYKLSDASIAKKVSTLTYEFVGEKYFKFSFAHNLQQVGYYSNSLVSYLNGSENVDVGGNLPSYTQSNNISGFDKTTPSFEGCYIHVTGEGYHRLDFIYEMYKPYGGDPYFVAATDDYLEIKDFQVLDKLPTEETTEIELEYDPTYGTVYIDNKPTEPGTVTVPKGYKVMFAASTVSSVQSKIDPDQQVPVRWCGWYTENENVIQYANVNYTDGLIWPDPGNCGLTFSETGANGNNDFKMTGHKITAKMQEFAAAPQVSISPQIDGLVKPEYTLTNGERYEIDYGSSIGNVAVLMKDFENIKSTYHVKINDVARDDIQIAEEAGRKMFSLSNITSDTKVTVYYSADGYYDSTEFNFTIAIVYRGTLEKDILVDEVKDITVENDEFLQWKFDAGLSGENGIAFVAGNSGSLGYYGKAVSSLKFTVQDAGVLDFDFKVYKNSCWLIYGDQPVSITDTIGGASRNDDKGETVWWINRTENSWNRIIARGSSSQKEVSNNNYMYWFQGTTYDGGKGYYMTDDGWAHVSIPVGEDSQTKDVYISYFRNSDTYIGATPYTDITGCDYAAIRNVGFWKGKGAVNFDISNEKGGTVSATATEKLTAGKDKNNSVSLGSRVTFDVALNDGYQFYGWVDKDNNLISTKEQFSCNLVDDVLDLTAVVEPTGTYYLRENGRFFKTLDEGVNALESTGGKLYVIKDNLTVESSLVIPAGIDIIFPVNDLGDYTEVGTENTAITRVAWTQPDKYKLFTFNVSSNATITIKGGLYLGGVLHYPNQSAQAHTSGKYHEMKLDGNIVVENGGVLDIYGLVTGDGGIVVESGGELYQPFLIADYSGGTNTQSLFGDNQTPFRRYAMVNIQCKEGYTIKYGGELIGHASLFFWGGVTTIDQPFISFVGNENGKDGTYTLINLKSEAQVKGVYDDKHARPTHEGEEKEIGNAEDIGKTQLTFNGDATAGFMTFPLGITTSRVAFSIPYNYEIVLASGTFTMEYAYKLMPGATLIVNHEATLDLDADFYVYDGLVQTGMSGKYYPSARQLTAAGYSSNANLIVDGILQINEHNFYGAVQTNGTGTIHVAAEAKLSGTIIDGGGPTGYDCNYAEFDTAAKVYGWVGGVEQVVNLEVGKTYLGVNNKEWTLPSVEVRYESRTGNHSSGHDLASAQTEAATLKGYWKVQHEPHSKIDWTLTPEEIPTDGNKLVHVKRYCDQFCDYFEEKYLLFDGTRLDAGEYTGVAFDEAAIKALFEKLFGQIEGVSFNFDPFTEAGEHIVTIILPENYYWCSSDGQTLVSQKEITVDVQRRKVMLHISEQGKVYDGAEAALSAEQDVAFTIVDGSFAATLPGLAFEFTVDGEHINVADYAYTVSYTDTKNYDITFDNGASHEYKITAREITVNVLDGEKVYDGTDAKLEGQGWTLESGDIAEQASPDIVLTIQNAAAAAGEYQITAQYNNANYTVHFNYTADGHSTYTVNEREITVTIKNVTRDYNGEIASVGSVKDSDYTVEGDLCSVAPGITLKVENAAKDATTYHIVGEWSNKNYAVTFKGENSEETYATYQITPFALTLTFKKALGKVYDGETVTNITVTEEEFYDLSQKVFDRDDLQISLTVQNAKNQGSYNVVCIANNGNYAVTFKGMNGEETVSYVISKRALTVRADSFSSAYGDELQNWNVFHVDGAVESEREAIEALVSVACDVQKDGELRAYDIVVSVREDAILDNYTLSKTNGMYTLTSAQWKGVTFANVTCKYDGNAHKLEVAGIPDGSTVTYSYKEQQQNKPFEFTDAETYNVSVSVTHEGYSEAFTAQAILTIEKIKGTITVKNKSKIYDGDIVTVGSVKDVDWTFAGATDGDTLVEADIAGLISLSIQDPAADARAYNITAKVNNDNYELQIKGETDANNGIYTVDKREITVTIKNVTRDYNGEIASVGGAQDSDYTVEGDLCSVAPGITLKVEQAAKDATTYHIVGEWSNKNYAVTFKGENSEQTYAVYTINKAQITVTLVKQGKIYDGVAIGKTLSLAKGTDYTMDKDPFAGDNLKLSFMLDADKTDVGEYDITCDYDNDNYAVKFEGDKVYAITSREITVTIKNVTRDYNGEIASVGSVKDNDYTVEGDLCSVVPGITLKVEQAAKDATTYHIVGEWSNKNYAVTFKGENSEQTYAVYTINKAQITVTIKNVTRPYNGQIASVGSVKDTDYTIVGNVAQNDELNIVLNVEQAAMNVATYHIAGEWSNANYEVTFKGEGSNNDYATYEITPRDVSAMISLKVAGADVNKEPFETAYTGQDILVRASLADGAKIGEDIVDVEIKIDGAVGSTLRNIKTYSVVVTVVGNADYTGTKTFSVNVAHVKGYTQHIVDILDRVFAVDITGIDADNFEATDEVYMKLKTIAQAAAELSTEELQALDEADEAKLASYTALAEAWDSAIENAQSVIELAKKVADAPIKGLFQLAMEISALLALAFVGGKRI